MSSKTLGGVVAGIVTVVLACVMGGVVLIGGVAGACGIPADPNASPVAPAPGGWPTIARFDSDQVGNAATIISVGAQVGVPTHGWVVAVATALQESQLRNLAGGDQDSIGLFQQRPSQGWGTPSQLRDPAYAAGKFYERLLTIPGWQDMPLTQAAQAVQHSAFPNAYARHEADATRLVATLAPLVQTVHSAYSVGSSDICGDGAIVLARASTWLTAWQGGPVPYLSSADPATWQHGYRRDCSGYASMALGLNGPGLTTAELADQSTPIAKADLQPGDLLINPAPNLKGHVVIFDHWTDTAMTSYVGYEQSGDGGTHHRVVPYPYFGGYPMSPYRHGVLNASAEMTPVGDQQRGNVID